MSATPRGVLRVTVPLTYGVQFVTPAVTEFLAAFAQISVELDLTNRMVDIVEEGFDAAVRIGTLADSSFVARPLKPYAMTRVRIACVSRARGHACDARRSRGSRVPRVSCIWAARRAGGSKARMTRMHAHRTQSARFRANNGQALKKAALARLRSGACSRMRSSKTS